MTDARWALQQLRDEAGGSYDARAMHADLAAVEHRVESARIWRSVLVVATLAIFAGVAIFAVRYPWGAGTAPIARPSSAPTTSSAAGDAPPAWCSSARVVPGKALGNIGGFEGWYNSTQDAPCDEWDQRVKDHPDTVWVNTIDNTLLEAYYRTDIDALGVYGDLSGDFQIPDPDPSWPKDRLVLIDPKTGEVLDVADPADYPEPPAG